MTWYLTKLVFEIKSNEHNRPAQFDEQWRLILAADQASALAKACTLGELESESLVNHEGKKIGWNFMHVTDLFHFGEIMDGAEIFSRIEQPENLALYLSSVEARANHAKQQCLVELN